MKKKTIAAIMAIVLLIGGVASVTLAYLQDTTTAVTNTFTIGAVDIDLKETLKPDGTEVSTGVTDWSAQLVPGTEYKKNPTVSVIRANTNVDIYLFVKFDETNNPSTYLTYTSKLTTANGWTQGDGTQIPANVWYREVGKNDTTISWELLDGNKVTVKTEVGGSSVPMPAGNETPSLTYTAYGIQKDNLTPQQAWAQFNN